MKMSSSKISFVEYAFIKCFLVALQFQKEAHKKERRGKRKNNQRR